MLKQPRVKSAYPHLKGKGGRVTSLLKHSNLNSLVATGILATFHVGGKAESDFRVEPYPARLGNGETENQNGDRAIGEFLAILFPIWVFRKGIDILEGRISRMRGPPPPGHFYFFAGPQGVAPD